MNHASLETRVKNKDVNMGINMGAHLDRLLVWTTQQHVHTAYLATISSLWLWAEHHLSSQSPTWLQWEWEGGGPHCKTCTGESSMTMTRQRSERRRWQQISDSLHLQSIHTDGLSGQNKTSCVCGLRSQCPSNSILYTVTENWKHH